VPHPDPPVFVPPSDVERHRVNALTEASSFSTLLSIGSESRADIRYSLDRTGRSNMVLIAAVRAVLAFFSAIIVSVTPQQPEGRAIVVYTSLVAYSIYSILVVWALTRSRSPVPHRALAWCDVAFAGYLVSLTDGTNSIFFFFFFFPVFSAAFTRGFREGMQITVASTIVFIAVGLLIAPFPEDAELDRALIRPINMLALGFMVSHWGGGELELKRQLALLSEITTARHFRVGAEATIAAALRRICAYFGATSAVLALERGAGRGSGRLHTAAEASGRMRSTSQPASRQTIRMFMATSARARAWPRRSLPRVYTPIDTPSRMMEVAEGDDAITALANLLESTCVALTGYRQRDGAEGRLVLTRNRKGFSNADALFLAQCARALAAVVETITLTEELVARAADFERLSISRDLHDTTVQPYIGLRMAIEGVARDFRDSPQVAERIARLIELTDLGIEELRDYAKRLKSGSGTGSSFLRPAIERQAGRLARFYGLHVDLHFDASLQLETRVADAIFQLVSEGLSNVVRHTAARSARVAIRSVKDRCVVEIANPLPEGSPPPPFVPQSIAERATEMRGRIAVTPAGNGETVVTITIPLRFPTP